MQRPSQKPPQQPLQEPPHVDYNSEDEDQPRVILNTTDGLFVYDDFKSLPAMKLSDFETLLPQTPITSPNLDAFCPITDWDAVRAVESKLRIGRNRFTGTKFDVVDSLENMFALRNVNRVGPGHARRFCLRRRFVEQPSQLKTMLIYTNGTRYSSPGGATGCAFKFSDSDDGTVAFRMEDRGPEQTEHVASLMRVALRAVLAALEYKDWWREGWTRVVVSTTYSTFLSCCTSKDATCSDLQRRLYRVLEKYAGKGCEVSIVPQHA